MVKNMALEVAGLESIVLTLEGRVVGLIDVRVKESGSVELLGRAVNLDYFAAPDGAMHSFAVSGSIRATDSDEVASASLFLEALKAVR